MKYYLRWARNVLAVFAGIAGFVLVICGLISYPAIFVTLAVLGVLAGIIHEAKPRSRS